jgi:hypothetical protein
VKRNKWLRLGTVFCASVLMGVAAPGLASAQTSGQTVPRGIEVSPASPVQLPRTGNPEAETTSSMGGLTGIAVAGGALATLLVIRRRVHRGARR